MTLKRILLYTILSASLLILNRCASAPKNIDNICNVLSQKNGWFINWESSTIAASKHWNIPIPILLATIYAESSFKANAAPPRTKLLGFIPWRRQSSSYGYTQAVNGTWKLYTAETNRFRPSRSSFSDSVDFIAWYYNKIATKHHINRSDTYALYIFYHMGMNYSGSISSAPIEIKRRAQRVQSIAKNYEQQLYQCHKL